eukprot:symbB.v1.2.010709.t1/scaffold676.1/size173388/16
MQTLMVELKTLRAADAKLETSQASEMERNAQSAGHTNHSVESANFVPSTSAFEVLYNMAIDFMAEDNGDDGDWNICWDFERNDWGSGWKSTSSWTPPGTKRLWHFRRARRWAVCRGCWCSNVTRFHTMVGTSNSWIHFIWGGPECSVHHFGSAMISRYFVGDPGAPRPVRLAKIPLPAPELLQGLIPPPPPLPQLQAAQVEVSRSIQAPTVASGTGGKKPKKRKEPRDRRASDGREDDISKEIEALLSRSGANLQKADFDSGVRRYLGALRGCQNGPQKVKDAMEMLHTYTSQKSRSAVKNWPAYLLTLLKRFEPGALNPKRLTDGAQGSKRAEEKGMQPDVIGDDDSEECSNIGVKRKAGTLKRPAAYFQRDDDEQEASEEGGEEDGDEEEEAEEVKKTKRAMKAPPSKKEARAALKEAARRQKLVQKLKKDIKPLAQKLKEKREELRSAEQELEKLSATAGKLSRAIDKEDKAKAVKRKRREKSMHKRANQRAKDLRGRLQDAKSEVSKMKFAKETAQKKLMAAQKDYKKISSTGDEFTHHGFAAKRTLHAAKDDLTKASQKLQRAQEEANLCAEKLQEAQVKICNIKEKTEKTAAKKRPAAKTAKKRLQLGSLQCLVEGKKMLPRRLRWNRRLISQEGSDIVIMLVEEGYAMFSAWIHEDDIGFLQKIHHIINIKEDNRTLRAELRKVSAGHGIVASAVMTSNSQRFLCAPGAGRKGFSCSQAHGNQSSLAKKHTKMLDCFLRTVESEEDEFQKWISLIREEWEAELDREEDLLEADSDFGLPLKGVQRSKTCTFWSVSGTHDMRQPVRCMVSL